MRLSAAAERGRPGSRPSCECQAEGSRWPSNGRSRTSRSEDVLPRSRAQGRCGGNHLVDLSRDHEQPLSLEPVGVGQRIEGLCQRLEVCDRAAGSLPGFPELGRFGHAPEDPRQVASGQQKNAGPDGRVHGRHDRRDDSPQADPGNSQARWIDAGAASQPADCRRTSQTPCRIAVIVRSMSAVRNFRGTGDGPALGRRSP